MKITKAKINQIINNPKLKNKVELYLKIKNATNTLEMEESFCSLYDFRANTTGLKKDEFERFKTLYFDIYKKYKSKPETKFITILKEVDDARKKVIENPKDKRKEISFSSKLLHTINNKKPIWDKHLVSLNNFNLNNNHEEWTEKDCGYAYDVFCNCIEDFIQKDEMAAFIKSEFKKKFKNDADQIEDIKKIDFVLWNNR